MTVIVGLIKNDKIYMGADSCCSIGGMSLPVHSKLIKIGNLLIGSSGSTRQSQIIQHLTNFPVQAQGQNDLDYLIKVVADSMRKSLKDVGSAKIRENVESSDVYFLVGYKHKLYIIFSDYTVLPVTGDFMSIGSGSDLALGALAATEDLPPKKRLIKAMEIAATYNLYVRAPFNILTLKNNQ